MIDFKQAFNEPFKASDSTGKIGILYGINIGFYLLLFIVTVIWIIALASVGVEVNNVLPNPCESGGCPKEIFAPVMLPIVLAVLVFTAYMSGYSLEFMKNIMNKEESPLPCFRDNTKCFIIKGFKAILASVYWVCFLFIPVFLLAVVSALKAILAPGLIAFIALLSVLAIFVAIIAVFPAMSYSQMIIAYGLDMKKVLNPKFIWKLFSKTWKSYLAFVGIMILYTVVNAVLNMVALGWLLGILSLVVTLIINAIFAYIFVEALEKTEGNME